MWFSGQSVFKHLLTEADRIVLSYSGTSLHDQGVFAMAQSYGALAARLLLQPVEEVARIQFSKMGETAARARTQVDGGTGKDLTAARSELSGELDRMHSLLVLLLKAVSWLGLVFFCFGVNYTPTLLRVLPGERWATPEAASTLSWYCAYILTLAVNGMCEAFIYAVATEAEVLPMTSVHFACWVLFAVLVGPLMGVLGTAGVVAANCLVMALRGAYAATLARRYLNIPAGSPTTSRTSSTSSKRRSLWPALPHAGVAAAFAASAVVTRLSEQRRLAATAEAGGSWLVPAAVHVAVGGVLGVAVVGLTWLLEGQALATLRQLSETRRAKQD